MVNTKSAARKGVKKPSKAIKASKNASARKKTVRKAKPIKKAAKRMVKAKKVVRVAKKAAAKKLSKATKKTIAKPIRVAKVKKAVAKKPLQKPVEQQKAPEKVPLTLPDPLFKPELRDPLFMKGPTVKVAKDSMDYIPVATSRQVGAIADGSATSTGARKEKTVQLPQPWSKIQGYKKIEKKNNYYF